MKLKAYSSGTKVIFRAGSKPQSHSPDILLNRSTWSVCYLVVYLSPSLAVISQCIKRW